MIHLPVKRLTTTSILPTRGSDQAIGLDLYADVEAYGRSAIRINAGCRFAVSVGIAVAIPHGFYGRVAPRSGLAAKQGIDVLAGVIDEDYRGEMFVLLLNTSQTIFMVNHGDRIGQLILERAAIMPVIEVGELPDTARGTGGFGSTGVSL